LEKIEIITQGFIQGDDHLLKIKQLLSIDGLQTILFNVAYVKTSGINHISSELEHIKEKLTIFAGMRNGITSIQSVFSLLDLGANVYLVDTGTVNIVYHPKIYIFEYKDCYRIITGSANLTSGGLNSNIEISSIFEIEKDNNQVIKIIKCINDLPNKYSNNIFKVKNKKTAFEFFKKGLLTDERITTGNSSAIVNHHYNKIDKTPRIKLKNIKTRNIIIKKHSKKIKKLLRATSNTVDQWVMVWESNELTERDLNIPSGSNTNPTGSMLFKKGNFENIDQRTYFREQIFYDLAWEKDQNPSKAHLERSMANFQFEIRGINYGIYNLKITHNTNKDSESYNQKNSMTQIHWGDAKEIIAHEELLGEKLELYRNDNNPPVFKIKIG
jgi:HKD family nuclease